MSTSNLSSSPIDLLSSARAVLVMDWPSADVPNTLAAFGLQVYVKGGPRETDFAVYTTQDGKVQRQFLGRAPDRVDFVYAYRPISEMPGIIERARQLSARAIWFQSGKSPTGAKDERGCWLDQSDSNRLTELAASEGLMCVTAPYILDVAAAIGA